MNRIMVGLPTAENREMILTTLLGKEKVEEGLDMKLLAAFTEGYSGSDLKVCFHFFHLENVNNLSTYPLRFKPELLYDGCISTRSGANKARKTQGYGKYEGIITAILQSPCRCFFIYRSFSCFEGEKTKGC